MKKTSKWLRALLGQTKETTLPNPACQPSNKCWCFVTCNNNNNNNNKAVVTPAENTSHNDNLNKQMIANGEVEVVRLRSTSRLASTTTNCGSSTDTAYLSGSNRLVWAAVKIQSHFRAYLSRKALRALKSLVKLQALVRGQIVRKQTIDNIRRVHALVRVQARARARRSNISEHQPIFYNHPLFRNDSRSDEKIVEGQKFDHENTHISPKRLNNLHSSHLNLCLDKYSQTLTTSKEAQQVHRIAPNMSQAKLQPLDNLTLIQNAEVGYYQKTFTPSKSDYCLTSCLGAFSEHPNYMSFTVSSRAKRRSLSAPKQRTQYERSSSAKREFSNKNCYDFRFDSQKVSEFQDKFSNKLYPGSGRL